ncbi:hypothetical protein [Clostridium sp. D46t1_190503_E9]|uniref:BppU family phage baseplate upper protein n=1 Tax=Clostridium sp. D46t1_190503_E9 TaxID=2787137 RepID=UPI001897F5E2|nr:hypothetical protein [Clostridium sp. D46t1_190503_E9]
MASKLKVDLDTSKESYILPKCKQNDDLLLEANIYENGTEKSLTNAIITIQALKADNTYIIQNTDIIIENNKIKASLDRDFTRVAGKTKIEIVLIESSKQNTTSSFELEVIGSVIKGSVESGNTVTILEELQDKIVEAGTVKGEAEQLIQNGGAATKGDIQKVNASLEENKNSITQLQKDIGTTANIAELITANNEATQKISELDSKLAQVGNISNTIKNVEDAKEDFNGKIHANLSERLESDMSYINDRYNNASLLEYEDKYISASESYDGFTKDLKIKGRTIKNLLGDIGNCESMTGWNGSTDATIDNKLKLFGNSSMKFNAVNLNSNRYTEITLDSTHKYFVSANFYLSTFTSGECTLLCTDYGAWTNGVKVSVDTTKLNQWQKKSTIITGRNGIRLQVGAGVASTLTANVDGVCVYDLTEIYGVGKEPTNISQLEADLPYVDGIVSSNPTVVKSIGKNIFSRVDIMPTNVQYDEKTGEYNCSIGSANNKISNNIKIKPFTSYTISFDAKSDVEFTATSSDVIRIDSENSDIKGYTGQVGTKYSTLSFIIPNTNNRNTINVLLRNVSNHKLTIKNIQIEEGTVSTSYEPYKEDKVSVSLTEPLRSLPNGVKDEIDFENSKVTRKIGKIVLNGSESIILQETSANTLRFGINIKNPILNTSEVKVISDKFTSYSQNGMGGIDTEGISSHSANGIQVRILKSKLSTQDVAGLKTWLSQNPVTVYYELETPIETTLEIQNRLRTYDKKTNIFTEGSIVDSNVYAKISSDVITALDIRHSTVKNKLFNSADERIEELEKDVKNIITQEEWIEPTLLNGWTNHDINIRYKKDKFGRVTIHGSVKGGVVGSPTFILPVGYRPFKPIRTPVVSNGEFGYAYLTMDGNVTIIKGSNVFAHIYIPSFDTV